MKSKSFTLIELLVVIVIIGILAGVIMISTSSSIDKANFAKAHSFSSTVQNELLSNLVSEWTFDNSSNYGEDTWGNNDGTVTGTTPQLKENCVFGTCLSLNGTSSDYINCGSFYSDQKSVSACVWIKQNLYQTARVIGHNWEMDIESNVYNIRLRNSTTYAFYFSSNYHPTDYVNEWVHWCFSSDGVNLKQYLNGMQILNTLVSTKLVLPINEATETLYIGRYVSGSYFNGLIDDVRIYNAALSSSKIKQNYIAGLDSLLNNGNISKEDYNQRINELAYE